MKPFSFGEKFKITVFGSSHGPHLGVEIDGCPSGVKISKKDIQLWLDRRKPGKSLFVSRRKEEDKIIIEKGIKKGKTDGKKIRMLIKNKNIKPSDYSKFAETPRPGHADYPALIKYKKIETGGGFFSGRMTAAFVMAGAVAKKLLEKHKIKTMAFAKSIGNVSITREISDKEIISNTYNTPIHTADFSAAKKMAKEIQTAQKQGDSVGGIVECRIVGVPPGIGEPMFSSLESILSHAAFAIPAAKGIEFGAGFSAAHMRGSENNDAYLLSKGKVMTKTNNAGGILGGLSTGMPIVFRVAFKPTSSISKPQKTLNLKTMKMENLKINGRHDPCIAIRAVPVVESVAAICIADILFSSKR